MGPYRQAQLIAAVLITSIAVASCEVVKSETPLSPSVAGPIAGVSITAPTLLDPINNKRFKSKEQPITLSLQNATSTGVRPLYYRFEVATDDAFTNPLFANPNVPPGDGKTAVRLPDALPTDKVYYWRARAEDGANTGPYAISAFVVLAPVVINAPTLVEPIGGAKVTTNSPVLRANNAKWSGPVGTITYRFELALDSGFGSMVGATNVTEAIGQTTWTTSGLSNNKTYYWRVQASDPDAISPWSAVESFVVGVPPAPTPTPGGNCGPPYASTPLGIVQCRRAQYPTPMSSSQTLDFERKVAKDLNAAGIPDGPFGVLRKTAGMSCNGYACDIICSGQGTSQKQWDILYDSDNTAVPTWNGPATYPNIRVDVCEIQ